MWGAQERGLPAKSERGSPDKVLPSRLPAAGRRSWSIRWSRHGLNVLLWTQGNAPNVALRGKNFYKEGKGIPAPLLLKRFAGHGGWEESCRSVLGLSKMNWNNDSLYDRLPVTMAYAQILAGVIKRMPHLPSQTYQFRFFM